MRKTSLILALLILIVLGGVLYFFTKTGEYKEPDNSSADNERVENSESQNITLYYYDQNKDKDQEGNVLCSDKGLVSVERTISKGNTPIQDAVKLLLKGELTSAERAQGVSTEFPLSGVELVGANLNNGLLTLEFKDPENRTSGGSCRVSILRAQIEKTVMQFSGVEKVVFKPNEIFQP